MRLYVLKRKFSLEMYSCGMRISSPRLIVERISAYPGIGNLAIDAVINRDFPLIQGLVLLFGLIFILINIGVDLTVAALNPRLRHA